MSGKVLTPVAPLQSYHRNNPRAVLSEAEQTLYDEVLAHFSPDSYVLPDTEKGELMDAEKLWLSRECFLRYLRATKWKSASAAIRRLENTLKWRRDFGIYDKLTPDYIEPEAVTGKSLLFGYDVEGEPAFYMIPSRQNTEESPRQVEFAVWMLERSIDLMPPGVETVAWLINFAQRAKSPSLGIARQVVNILQDHYPERLGLALAINVPFLVNTFFRLVLPFVDPTTRAKLKFNPDVVKDGIFAEDMVMRDGWGGCRDFAYEHDTYWAALVGNVEENTTRWMNKWRELGAHIGISEWEYKEGDKKTVVEGAEVDELPNGKLKDGVAVVPVSRELGAIPDIVIQPATATFGLETKQDNTDVTHSTAGGHSADVGAVALGGGDGGESGGGDAGDGGAAE